MGGTSPSLLIEVPGRRVYELHVARWRCAPAMDIHTVRPAVARCAVTRLCSPSGRKATARFRGAMLRRGAHDGELTVTDAKLALGRWWTTASVPAQREPVDRYGSRARERPPTALRARRARGRLLRGGQRRMAEAIRRFGGAGRDPRDFALVVFGGAGGQHACALARCSASAARLRPPRRSPVCLGMGLADVTCTASRRRAPPLEETAIATASSRRSRSRMLAMEAEGFARPASRVRRSIDLRYRGSDTASHRARRRLAGPFEAETAACSATPVRATGRDDRAARRAGRSRPGG